MNYEKTFEEYMKMYENTLEKGTRFGENLLILREGDEIFITYDPDKAKGCFNCSESRGLESLIESIPMLEPKPAEHVYILDPAGSPTSYRVDDEGEFCKQGGKRLTKREVYELLGEERMIRHFKEHPDSYWLLADEHRMIKLGIEVRDLFGAKSCHYVEYIRYGAEESDVIIF